ncbi:MAG: dTDP-4-dehydrorhamnose reductase [Chitinophagaceae bacterium]|nr:dTDP-4-dehydrorhamnose reductase [Chitinophagaceae bacterium]
MSNKKIIVTGVGGQLGWSIKQLSNQYPSLDFVFADLAEMDLTNEQSIKSFIQQNPPAYFIHCAAYTAVDKAETEKEIALAVNATAVEIIAKECVLVKAKLIAISTDYVFDGNGTKPYQPYDATDPINYYGYTKWLGEQAALNNNPETIIIRTSWVYCQHGNNFVKTMLRLMKEKEELKIVGDQVGCPTYAPDLAKAILKIVEEWENGNNHKGIYHYSNSGVISWFDFAAAIKDMAGLDCNLFSIPTTAYPTPAKRPAYSVMDTSNIVEDFNVAIPEWKESLQVCLKELGV